MQIVVICYLEIVAMWILTFLRSETMIFSQHFRWGFNAEPPTPLRYGRRADTYAIFEKNARILTYSILAYTRIPGRMTG